MLYLEIFRKCWCDTFNLTADENFQPLAVKNHKIIFAKLSQLTPTLRFLARCWLHRQQNCTKIQLFTGNEWKFCCCCLMLRIFFSLRSIKRGNLFVICSYWSWFFTCLREQSSINNLKLHAPFTNSFTRHAWAFQTRSKH